MQLKLLAVHTMQFIEKFQYIFLTQKKFFYSVAIFLYPDQYKAE